MKMTNSKENDESSIHEDTVYIFFNNDNDIVNTSTENEELLAKFDKFLNTRSVLFNFTGDSHLSDHISKLDFYKNKRHEFLTRKDILEYRKRMIEKCNAYKNEYKNYNVSGIYTEQTDDYLATCCLKCILNQILSTYSTSDSENKIINICKGYIIDLKFLLAKAKVEDKEIEIFDKIIFWMHNLFEKISNEDRNNIFVRLRNEFSKLDYSYTIVINFLAKYFYNMLEPN